MGCGLKKNECGVNVQNYVFAFLLCDHFRTSVIQIVLTVNRFEQMSDWQPNGKGDGRPWAATPCCLCWIGAVSSKKFATYVIWTSCRGKLFPSALVFCMFFGVCTAATATSPDSTPRAW